MQHDGGGDPGVSRLQCTPDSLPFGAQLGANTHQAFAGPDYRVSFEMVGEFLSAPAAPFPDLGSVPQLLQGLERDHGAMASSLFQIERGSVVSSEDV